MSFVFYDTETTGTHTAFDQILQFGAIRTDHELRELERFEIRCRLLPHVVPSPKALLTNGITVEQLTDPSLPSHYQMVRAIKAKLEAWSPAVFVGHNSMRFDEHLLRQAFYQTLHPPYLTNTNGNGRMDSLPVLQAVHLLEPGVLTVPVDDQGRPRFSLDRLAPANGFAQHAACGPVGNVEATLYLCCLVRERTETVWSNCVRFSRKAAVLDYALPGEVFALVGFGYGRTQLRMVTPIGVNPENDSEVFVFDLAHDPMELTALPGGDLGRRLADSHILGRLRANAAPCILPYEDMPARARLKDLSIADLTCRAAYIREKGELVQQLVSVMTCGRQAKQASLHVENRMYEGFTGPEDMRLMALFHEMEWPDRAPLLARLEDPRLQVLGKRLLYTEVSEAMPAKCLESYRADVAKRLMADEGAIPWLTVPRAIREADRLLPGLKGAEASLVRHLRKYLAQRAGEARALME